MVGSSTIFGYLMSQLDYQHCQMLPLQPSFIVKLLTFLGSNLKLDGQMNTNSSYYLIILLG